MRALNDVAAATGVDLDAALLASVPPGGPAAGADRPDPVAARMTGDELDDLAGQLRAEARAALRHRGDREATQLVADQEPGRVQVDLLVRVLWMITLDPVHAATVDLRKPILLAPLPK